MRPKGQTEKPRRWPDVFCTLSVVSHSSHSPASIMSGFVIRHDERAPVPMMFLRLALLVLSMLSTAAAQQPSQQKDTSPAAQTAHELGREPGHEDDPLADGAPVVTHHQITAGGKPLKYTATAGRILLKPESGPTEAAIFFTAYTLDGEDAHM